MKTILLLVVGLGCLCLYSCQRGYYAPNAQNVPLFQQRGETRFIGSISEEGKNTFDLKAAWSPIKHIGITGNYFNTIYDEARGHYYDIGAGAYFPFRHFVAELYGGIGQGYAFNDFELNRFIKNDFRKYYLQFNLGFTTKYIDVAYSGRFARLSLYNIRWWQTNDSTSREHSSELTKDLVMLQNNRDVLLYEPALTIRLGWKYVKLQGQLTTTSFISSKQFNIQDSNISLGLLITLANKNKPAWQPFKFRNIFKF